MFSARRYVGNALARDINGLGFSPDLVWIKERGSTSSHQLFDSVRGVGNSLNSDGTWAQGSGGGLTAFNNDGFSLKVSDTTTNQDGIANIGWCWKAGGAPSGSLGTIDATTTSGAGTISSSSDSGYSLIQNATSLTQSVNRDSGFSITKFTGSASGCTIPHNLGGTPEFFIIKNLDQSQSWACWHKNLSATTQYRISLDLANAELQESPAGSGKYFPTAPDSTTITCGSDDGQGGSTDEFICYAWKAVSGVSAFGNYTGSGGAYNASNGKGGVTGLSFKPRWVMLKGTASSNRQWVIHDAFRVASDTKTSNLYANLTNGDDADASHGITFEDDGFKFTSDNDYVSMNGADGAYIYMAFA